MCLIWNTCVVTLYTFFETSLIQKRIKRDETEVIKSLFIPTEFIVHFKK